MLPGSFPPARGKRKWAWGRGYTNSKYHPLLKGVGEGPPGDEVKLHSHCIHVQLQRSCSYIMPWRVIIFHDECVGDSWNTRNFWAPNTHGTNLIGRHTHWSHIQKCQGCHSVFHLHGKQSTHCSHVYSYIWLCVIFADVRKVVQWKWLWGKKGKSWNKHSVIERLWTFRKECVHGSLLTTLSYKEACCNFPACLVEKMEARVFITNI